MAMPKQSTAQLSEMGVNMQEKFDAKKPLRGQTGDDKGQRPIAQSEMVKTDRGSFKMK